MASLQDIYNVLLSCAQSLNRMTSVLTAVPGLIVGSSGSTIAGGTNGAVLYNNSGALGNAAPANGIKIAGGNLELSLTSATYQTAPGGALNPTGTTSTTGVMMGMGGTFTLTTLYSSRVHVIITGNGRISLASNNLTITGYYGTGGAPANGAAITGTQFGRAAVIFNSVAGAEETWVIIALLTGVSPGTPYWFDVSVATSTSGTALVEMVTATLMEF